MSTDPPAAARTPKALLIGIDGLLFGRVDDVKAPTLRRLRTEEHFATSLIYPDGRTDTVSGPGWATITTGVWPAKHGVLDNDLVDHRLAMYPDLLTRAKRADPGVRTFSVTCWPPLATAVIGADVDHKYAVTDDDWAVADRETAAEACRVLAADDHDLGFVYFGSIDEAGHGHGAESREYGAAIEEVDQHLTRLLEVVRSRPSYVAEDWLVLVTTDHGHRPEGGHGGQSQAERSTFVIGIGAGLDPAAATRMRMVDIAPTLLDHIGVRADPAWELDGSSALANGATR